MTLTESAYWTRRLGVIGAVLFGAFIVITLIVVNWPEESAVPRYLKPTYTCTDTKEQFQEHRLSIPSLELSGGDEPFFTIETATGKIEELPLIANVYAYDNPGALLGAQNEAKKIALKFGFQPEQIKRRGASEYYWEEDAFGRSLVVQAASLNFTMSVNFKNSNAIPSDGELPTSEQAKQMAISFLQSNGWMLQDYKTEEPQTTDINIEPDGSFSEARSRGDAELIRVDFYRTKPFISVPSNIDGAEEIKEELQQEFHNYDYSAEQISTDEGKADLYNFSTEVVHEDTQRSNISIYIGPSNEQVEETSPNVQEVYGLEYYAWIVEPEPCGTYPLISATEVSNRIAKGEGSLVYLNEKDGDDVVPYTPQSVGKLAVNDVRIAYLDEREKRDFMQPIYIVIGEAFFDSGAVGRFYYYIPAIDYENLQDPAPVEATTEEQ
ncbi:MAG: hypothetical protein QY318_03825 [Candidatus Dojkabacteria bacterium]|nr:MAG: hypothetical protein QY318_03825 [Candidatus Dojkabacteria bacterium]